MSDLLMLYGMMLYQEYAITLTGGMDKLATLCQNKNILLPTWAPPCCLFPFLTNHPITTKTIKSITSFPAVLGIIKVAIIILHLVFAMTETRLENIEDKFSIISVPVRLTTIYCFTMFNIIMEDIMAGNKTRLIGTFLLIQYVLFDS